VERGGERMISKKDKTTVSQALMAASFISVLLAGVGYFSRDIWLASTQWLLVAIVMGLFGVYLRLGK
jgi:hypothetical protein